MQLFISLSQHFLGTIEKIMDEETFIFGLFPYLFDGTLSAVTGAIMKNNVKQICSISKYIPNHSEYIIAVWLRSLAE